MTLGVLLGGGGFSTRGAQRWVLSRIDLDQLAPEVITFAMGFLPHGFAFDPVRPQRAALFEKKGTGACVMDVSTGAIERELSPSGGRHFYGHGAFSGDGALLYATEAGLSDGALGVLAVRDGSTLEALGALPTHGLSPHDCLLLDDRKTMAIANGGGPFGVRGSSLPSVTFVEVASGKLLDRFVLPSPRINAGHLAVSSNGDVVVASAPRDGVGPEELSAGAITFRPTKSKSPIAHRAPPSVLERILGETLSVALDQTETRALATQPLGDRVTAWDVATGAYLGAIELVGPRGIARTLDGQHFVISHKREGTVVVSLFDALTLAPTGRSVAPSYTTGSHLVVRDSSARSPIIDGVRFAPRERS
jgi:hypothetical protein